MSVPSSLVRRKPKVVTLAGRAETSGEPLHAPASGRPCVYWRLRIEETIAPGMTLVHELASSETIELCCDSDEPGLPARRLHIAPEGARLRAPPSLFHSDSPQAAAIKERFSLAGTLEVRETAIAPGTPIEARGLISDPAAGLGRGPFRTIETPAELLGATLRVLGEPRLTLRPVLLPVALGAVAALLGSMRIFWP